jgi:glycine/D-amino acid oxidase-like deaminating enzyme
LQSSIWASEPHPNLSQQESCLIDFFISPPSFIEIAMISKADVVVVGSGGLGAATAYYLAKRGGLSVALLDKHDIGSQASPRAAGMVSCVRKGDLMIKLITDACRKIEAFMEETRQPLDWVHSGSLALTAPTSVALSCRWRSRPQHAVQKERQCEADISHSGLNVR